MIILGRHINGITINPLEYLLDDNDEVMEFVSGDTAKEFLKEKGFTDDDFYWLTFEYVNGEYDDCPVCGRMFACYDETECPHCNAPYERNATIKEKKGRKRE
jgi:rubrerythrin